MTILLLTNRADYTADFVVLELQRRNLDYIRFNTEDIPNRAKIRWSLADQAANYFEANKRQVYFNNITSIWFRRPVLPVPSPEITDPIAQRFVIEESRAAFGGLWRTLDCLWVSHPDCLYNASFKIVQLQLAQQLGFKLPATLVTNIPDAVQSFLSQFAHTIYKAISMGRIDYPDGDKLIFTNQIKHENLASLDDVKYAPCLFQSLIEKATDIRATVIGQKVFAVSIDSQTLPEARIDWRRGDVAKLKHRIIQLPTQIEEKCLEIVSKLGLQFGAIDLVQDQDGDYYFLEINGNGQWAWIEQLTELPLTSALVDLLENNGK